MRGPVIWPRPKSLESGQTAVWLDRDITLSFTHEHPDAHGARELEQQLRAAFERTVHAPSLIPSKLYGQSAEPEPSIAEQNRPFIQCCNVMVHAPGPDASPISNEHYTLAIKRDQSEWVVTCDICHLHGGLHAFQSLQQIFQGHSTDQAKYTTSAPLHIVDEPRFAHRGLNLDISRNRIGVDDVMRTIQAMAMAKLNRLHLHATDSQSWPLEIPALPELAEKCAYDKTQIWTAADLARVQEHGRLYGVQVVVEVSLCGSHSASIVHAFPELIVGYNMMPWQHFAAQPPSGQLDIGSPKVDQFVQTLLHDLLPRCSKYATYFHMGGDELQAKIYELESTIGSSDKDVIRPHLQKHVTMITDLLESYNLTPIVWQEMLLEWNLELPKHTIVQVWRHKDSLSKVVSKGHRALFGPCTSWYLDAGFGGWVDPDPDNADTPIKPPFQDWNKPYKSWRQVAAYDPFEGIPAEHHHLLYGGETSMWSELTDGVTLDGKLWPRAAVAAETMWSGPGRVDETMTRRLAQLRERMVLQGVGASMVQLEWSLRNPGKTVL